jgi:hypothetical protein
MFEYTITKEKMNSEVCLSLYRAFTLLDIVTNPVIFRYKNLAFLFTI